MGRNKINSQSLEDTQVGCISQTYTLEKYTSGEYTLRKYTLEKYTFEKYTLGKYTLGKYTLRKYTFCWILVHVGSNKVVLPF